MLFVGLHVSLVDLSLFVFMGIIMTQASAWQENLFVFVLTQIHLSEVLRKRGLRRRRRKV